MPLRTTKPFSFLQQNWMSLSLFAIFLLRLIGIFHGLGSIFQPTYFPLHTNNSREAHQFQQCRNRIFLASRERPSFCTFPFCQVSVLASIREKKGNQFSSLHRVTASLIPNVLKRKGVCDKAVDEGNKWAESLSSLPFLLEIDERRQKF